jgi:hypothetical protein
MKMSGQLHDPATFPPKKELPVPSGYDAGWAPEPVWTLWSIDKFIPFAGIELRPSKA